MNKRQIKKLEYRGNIKLYKNNQLAHKSDNQLLNDIIDVEVTLGEPLNTNNITEAWFSKKCLIVTTRKIAKKVYRENKKRGVL